MAEEIVTLNFHCIDDENDEDDDEGQRAAQLRAGELKEFLSYHPELAQVSCIGVKTGYTDRLYSRARELKAAVVFTDKCWQKGLKPLVLVPSVYENVKPIFNVSTVVFENTNANDVFGLIERLADAEYCAFCNAENIMRINWYKLGNETVMECCVDCESG